MTYEKGIPDYAMVPAKELEESVIVPITKGAIYSPVQVTDITEKQSTLLTLEEDILVPDIKPDLHEILLISGKPCLAVRETDQIARGDDYINVSGEVELQALYLPEKQEHGCPLVSIQTKIPFKDQWHMDLTPGTSLTLSCKTESIEHMVINERKFRVKIVLCVTAREYKDTKAEIFEGIIDEDLQTLKENIEVSSVVLRKKDSLSIREDIFPKESCRPESLLKQDICVVENYQQTAGDKIVVNGFIYVNLLYLASSGEDDSSAHPEQGELLVSAAGSEPDGSQMASAAAASKDTSACFENICQMQDRVEFTQFIPLPQAGDFSGVDICFDDSRLRIKLTQDDNGKDVFRLEGELLTYAALYRNSQRELIADGYHREKNFVCEFEEISCKTLVGFSTGEASVREIISVDGHQQEAARILYTSASVVSGESRLDQNKIITEGTICADIICLGTQDDCCLFVQKGSLPFRVVTAAPQLCGNEIVTQKIFLKDIWAEKINGKQIEFNGTVLVCAQILKPTPFRLIKNPAFEEGSDPRGVSSMVIYICRPGDTLWNIAKKFKTTMTSIRTINGLSDDLLSEGQKLLMVK